MARRLIRNVIATLAVTVGATDLTLAASARTGIRAEPIFVKWTYEVVIGGRYLLLIAGIILILSARALVHGKRNAWRLAMVADVWSMAGHHLKETDAVGLTISAVLLIALLAGRSAFVGRPDQRLARSGWRLLVAGELVVFIYGVAGLYFLDSEYRESTTLIKSLIDAMRLLVLLPTRLIEPVTSHGEWFVASVRFATLVVVLLALARVVSAVVVSRGTPSDRRAVEALLERWATTSLAYFHLLDDKYWFLASDGDSFIGYKVVGNVAVALGGPIGEPSSCKLVIEEYLDYCGRSGWTIAFHQVTPGDTETLAARGLKKLKIGEEAVIPVQSWSLDGENYKGLRSALRRVDRAGLEIVELPNPLPTPVFEQLRETSDEWLADGDHRERTFTLGRFDANYLNATVVLALRERETDRIVAFANIVPSYRSTAGNFDLMRRRPEAPNGAMDALFVALIQRFRAAGMVGMNLGMVPFVHADGQSLPDRAIRLLYERGERAFNSSGLFQFKNKWQPEWDSRYLVYKRDTDLPRVAAAIARAGEIPKPRSPLTFIRWGAHRFPFSCALIAVISWLMLVTNIDPDGHQPLLRSIGLSWNDLVHLQLWRLPMSQFIQTDPGFAWRIIALCFFVAPIAELRAGTSKAVITFFLCDWVSTVVVLIGIRIASDTPLALLSKQDGGSSSGAWALTVLAASTVTNQKLRIAILAAIGVFLVTTLIAYQRMFDVQHLVAAGCALMFVLVTTSLENRSKKSAA